MLNRIGLLAIILLSGALIYATNILWGGGSVKNVVFPLVICVVHSEFDCLSFCMLGRKVVSTGSYGALDMPVGPLSSMKKMVERKGCLDRCGGLTWDHIS